MVKPDTVYSLLDKDHGKSTLESVRPKVPRVWEVIATDMLRKKYVVTDKLRKLKEMVMPAKVQQYDIWNMGVYPGHEQVVFAQGLPTVTDLMETGKCTTVMNELVEWSVERVSDVAGCITIKKPVKVSERWWSWHCKGVTRRM